MSGSNGEEKKLNEQITSEIEAGVQALKHVPAPQEKVVLPSPQDILQEKTEQQLVSDIVNFDSSALKQVETEEKVVLPSKEDIQEEKKRLSTSEA